MFNINKYNDDDKFFIVLNAANYIGGYEFDSGLNDPGSLIYFTNIANIFHFLDCGPCFRRVIIPDNIPLLISHNDTYMLDKVIMEDIQLWTPENIKWLIDNGANISVDDFKLFKWALKYNFEVFYFLQEYICNIDESLWSYIVEKLEKQNLFV